MPSTIIESHPTPHALSAIRHVVLDMDGTIYSGSEIFPYTLNFLKRLKEQGIAVIGVDIDGSDWKGDPPDEELARIEAELASRGRGIIIMHDSQPNTAIYLPHLLDWLQQRGYRIVQIRPASAPTAPGSPPGIRSSSRISMRCSWAAAISRRRCATLRPRPTLPHAARAAPAGRRAGLRQNRRLP